MVQTDPRTGKQVTTLMPLLGYDGPVNAVDFQEHATNWSFGALYKLTPDLSVFARASHGTRFNADRLTNDTPSYFNAERLAQRGRPRQRRVPGGPIRAGPEEPRRLVRRSLHRGIDELLLDVQDFLAGDLADELLQHPGHP